MQIRKIIEQDRSAVIELMRIFYSSDAVWTNSSEEIFNNNIDACVSDSVHTEGYVFTQEKNIIGYGILARSYSTEFGKPCVLIEDIFILPEYRGKSLGTHFIQEIRRQFPDSILKIEVETYNRQALAAYKKNGFISLPYTEMVLLPDSQPLKR